MRGGGGKMFLFKREIFFFNASSILQTLKFVVNNSKIRRQQTKQIIIQKLQNKRSKNTNAILNVVSTNVKKSQKDRDFFLINSLYRQRAPDITFTVNELR